MSTHAVQSDHLLRSEHRRSLLKDPVIRVALVAFLGVILLYLTQPFDPEAWPFVVEAYLLIPIGAISLVAILWGLSRINARLERRFWQLWAIAMGIWVSVQLAYAFPPDIDARVLAFGIETGAAAFYLLVLYALSLNPHPSEESDDGHLRRRFEGVAISVFAFSLVVYFVVIASTLKPQAYSWWTPSLSLYVVLDALVLVRLLYLRWNTTSPRWTALYTGLAITAFLWTATDSWAWLANWGWAPAPGWGTGKFDWLWFLPFATLIATARTRDVPFPTEEAVIRPAETQQPKRRWSGVLVGCLVGLPLLHMALSLGNVTDPDLHDPREMLIFLTVFVLGSLALAYQHNLEEVNRRMEEEQRARDEERMVERVAAAKLHEQQRSAQALAEAQNLRRLGIMSSGIAQDFNRLLKVVLANTGLALRGVDSGRGVKEALSRIEDVVRRGSQFTNQLMAQSGRAQVNVQAIDLNELLRNVGEQVRTTSFEGFAMEYELSTGLPTLYGDITQITKVARSLVSQALEGHDASLGAATVRTRTLHLDQAFASGTQWGRKLPPGHYVELQVADHGPGIDPEAIALILNPLPAAGSGNDDPEWASILSVLGTHGGSIAIDSEPECGKTVTVMFPITKAVDESVGRHAPRSGTVLIVDPEPSTGTMLRRPLEQSGFTVLTAADGAEGVAAFRDHGVEISAVLLEAALAHGAGETALSEMHDLNPEVPVLLMSGCSSGADVEESQGEMTAGFLRKPFDAQTALDRLGDVIKA